MPLPALPGLPRLDAQLLLAYVLSRSRAWVIAHPEAKLDPEQQAHLVASLTQLESGVPLPYILGHWEFYGLDFLVTPDVLIPRPETELLVETARRWLQEHPHVDLAVDVGTGSGCIAVSLAVHQAALRLLAIDRSHAALIVARRNARAHQVADRITFLQSDLLSFFACGKGVGERIDLLLANLPYIPTQTLHNLPIFGKEPAGALDGGPDGLDLVRVLLLQAQDCLAPGGLALLEIESGQGAAALALGRRYFPAAQVQVLPDLAGLDRLLAIQTMDPI